MDKFIKLTRVKDDEEFTIYLNTRYIGSFYAREEGGSYIEIYFPDTIRKYIVKESLRDFEYLINLGDRVINNTVYSL